jgi:glycine oxidase
MLKKHVELQQNSGIRCEWVEGPRLQRLEPGLSDHVFGAAYSPRERHVNPGLITRAFASAAAKAGATIREKVALTGFLGRGAMLDGVKTNKGDEHADAVVLAAGPWTGDLTRRLGFPLRTPPMRGQMLAYRSGAVTHALWGDDGYLVPKPGGIVFAGATVEDAGFRKYTTKTGIAGLQRMARALVPALKGASLASSWAGLRPGSPDGLPVLGLVPGRENVYIAAGHFRNGVLLAPITGKALGALILNGREDPLIAPYTPERFAARKRQRP